MRARSLILLLLAGGGLAALLRRPPSSFSAPRELSVSRPDVRPVQTVQPVEQTEPVEQVERPTHAGAEPEPRGLRATAIRVGRNVLGHDVPMLAGALAYAGFFAIPSLLLLATGIFAVAADESVILDTTRALEDVIPPDAAELLAGSLTQLSSNPSSGVLLTIVGFLLALWSSVGAATAYLTAARRAYGVATGPGFLRQRLVALGVIGCIGAAAIMIATLLILGPPLQAAIGDAVGQPGAVAWLWWAGQWPVLIVVLTAAFVSVLSLGPSRPGRRYASHLPAALVVTFGWLAVSAAFAAYTAGFGSYNKTWGVLSAAVVTLTWLWLSSIALLVGAEVDAELERRADVRDDAVTK